MACGQRIPKQRRHPAHLGQRLEGVGEVHLGTRARGLLRDGLHQVDAKDVGRAAVLARLRRAMDDALARPALGPVDLDLAVHQDRLGARLLDRFEHRGRPECGESGPHPLLPDREPQRLLGLPLALLGEVRRHAQRFRVGRVPVDRARADQLVLQILPERLRQGTRRFLGAHHHQSGEGPLGVERDEVGGQFCGVGLQLLVPAPGVALLTPAALLDAVLDVAPDAPLFVHLVCGDEVDAGLRVVEHDRRVGLVLVQEFGGRAEVGRIPHPQRRADRLRKRIRTPQVGGPGREDGQRPLCRRVALHHLPSHCEALLEVLQFGRLVRQQGADPRGTRVDHGRIVARVEVDRQERPLGTVEVGQGAEGGGVEHQRRERGPLERDSRPAAPATSRPRSPPRRTQKRAAASEETAALIVSPRRDDYSSSSSYSSPSPSRSS